MGEHRRKADGRRVFSTEFKRTTVQRILTGEKTLAELSRELDIWPSVAFAIDCHDREVLAYVASPRPLTGADIRTLMDRALWTRFGEATLKARRTRSSGFQTTAPSTRPRPRGSTPMSWA